MRTVRLADERLNSRYCVLLDRLSSKPTLSLPAACNGWAETQAAYRFFDNDRNTPEELLRPHYDATLERIRPYPVVLIAQDTTEFDLTQSAGEGRRAAGRREALGPAQPRGPGRDAAAAGAGRRA